MVPQKLKSVADVKRVTMVYIREQSRTRAMLNQLMCLDVVILIEDYLIPVIPRSEDARVIRCAKLECGFAEYIEMEIGSQGVIEKMFLDACSYATACSTGDIFALLAAGARNLKSGLTAAIHHDNSAYIPRILVSLNAIGTADECMGARRYTYGFDTIDYIVNRPRIGHLLSMIGTIGHVEDIIDALQKCVKRESIEMIEILISKLREDLRQTALNDVLMYAVDYRSRRIIEYAIDSGANVQYILSFLYTKPIIEQWVIDMLEQSAYPAKRRRLEHSSSDS